jgi:hypothetical protein
LWIWFLVYPFVKEGAFLGTVFLNNIIPAVYSALAFGILYAALHPEVNASRQHPRSDWLYHLPAPILRGIEAALCVFFAKRWGVGFIWQWLGLALAHLALNISIRWYNDTKTGKTKKNGLAMAWPSPPDEGSSNLEYYEYYQSVFNLFSAETKDVLSEFSQRLDAAEYLDRIKILERAWQSVGKNLTNQTFASINRIAYGMALRYREILLELIGVWFQEHEDTPLFFLNSNNWQQFIAIANSFLRLNEISNRLLYASSHLEFIGGNESAWEFDSFKSSSLAEMNSYLRETWKSFTDSLELILPGQDEWRQRISATLFFEGGQEEAFRILEILSQNQAEPSGLDDALVSMLRENQLLQRDVMAAGYDFEKDFHQFLVSDLIAKEKSMLLPERQSGQEEIADLDLVWQWLIFYQVYMTSWLERFNGIHQNQLRAVLLHPDAGLALRRLIMPEAPSDSNESGGGLLMLGLPQYLWLKRILAHIYFDGKNGFGEPTRIATPAFGQASPYRYYWLLSAIVILSIWGYFNMVSLGVTFFKPNFIVVFGLLGTVAEIRNFLDFLANKFPGWYKDKRKRKPEQIQKVPKQVLLSLKNEAKTLRENEKHSTKYLIKVFKLLRKMYYAIYGKSLTPEEKKAIEKFSAEFINNPFTFTDSIAGHPFIKDSFVSFWVLPISPEVLMGLTYIQEWVPKLINLLKFLWHNQNSSRNRLRGDAEEPTGAIVLDSFGIIPQDGFAPNTPILQPFPGWLWLQLQMLGRSYASGSTFDAVSFANSKGQALLRIFQQRFLQWQSYPVDLLQPSHLALGVLDEAVYRKNPQSQINGDSVLTLQGQQFKWVVYFPAEIWSGLASDEPGTYAAALARAELMLAFQMQSNRMVEKVEYQLEGYPGVEAIGARLMQSVSLSDRILHSLGFGLRSLPGVKVAGDFILQVAYRQSPAYLFNIFLLNFILLRNIYYNSSLITKLDNLLSATTPQDLGNLSRVLMIYYF